MFTHMQRHTQGQFPYRENANRQYSCSPQKCGGLCKLPIDNSLNLAFATKMFDLCVFSVKINLESPVTTAKKEMHKNV
jgi:hypothetical protein